MSKLTIGQLSKITQVSAKTIRFYESKNILTPAQRGENGYRYYSPSAIEELKVIKFAREINLPISEIKQLLFGCCSDQKCRHSADVISGFLDKYTSQTAEKIKDLQNLHRKLIDLKGLISETKQECCCDILRQIINLYQKGGDNHV